MPRAAWCIRPRFRTISARLARGRLCCGARLRIDENVPRAGQRLLLILRLAHGSGLGLGSQTELVSAQQRGSLGGWGCLPESESGRQPKKKISFLFCFVDPPERDGPGRTALCLPTRCPVEPRPHLLPTHSPPSWCSGKRLTTSSLGGGGPRLGVFASFTTAHSKPPT